MTSPIGTDVQRGRRNQKSTVVSTPAAQQSWLRDGLLNGSDVVPGVLQLIWLENSQQVAQAG